MKFLSSLVVLAAVLGGCQNSRSLVGFSDQTIEYQSGNDEYSVVVVEGEGLTIAEAKKLAQVKAAEMAYEDGYRYITLEVAQPTEVVKSPYPQASQGNLYQELILDGGFRRDQLAREKISSEEIYSARRFVFKAYETKPNWKGIDVCTLIRCK